MLPAITNAPTTACCDSYHQVEQYARLIEVLREKADYWRAQATQSREVAALALSRLSQLRNTIQRDTVTSDHLHEDDYLDFSWQTQVVNPLSDTADRLDDNTFREDFVACENFLRLGHDNNPPPVLPSLSPCSPFNMTMRKRQQSLFPPAEEEPNPNGDADARPFSPAEADISFEMDYQWLDEAERDGAGTSSITDTADTEEHNHSKKHRRKKAPRLTRKKGTTKDTTRHVRIALASTRDNNIATRPEGTSGRQALITTRPSHDNLNPAAERRSTRQKENNPNTKRKQAKNKTNTQ